MAAAKKASGTGSATDPLPSPLAAVDDMRTTAKWMLAAIGAVGAALISGGPLAAVGQVHGVVHAIVAGAGLVLALFGVLLAIWFTTLVLTPRLTTPGAFRDPKTSRKLAKLTSLIDQEPAYFLGDVAMNVTDLMSREARCMKAVGTLATALQAEKDAEVRKKLEDQLAHVRADLARLDTYVEALLPLAHAWLVEADLKRSRMATLIGGVIVVIGAVLFFSVTGSSEPTYVPVLTPAVTAAPTPTPTATH
jgi:hypothetical protein